VSPAGIAGVLYSAFGGSAYSLWPRSLRLGWWEQQF